jgi:PAS domain S-box-containing protein
MLLPFSIDPAAQPDNKTSRSEPPPESHTGTVRKLPPDSRPPPAPDADADQLRAVFAASPLPIVALDPRGRITLWSRAAETAFGWTSAEALGRVAPDEFVDLCARALSGESLVSVPVAFRVRSGDAVDAQVSIAPMRNARGDIQGVVAIYAIMPRDPGRVSSAPR